MGGHGDGKMNRGRQQARVSFVGANAEKFIATELNAEYYQPCCHLAVFHNVSVAEGLINIT